MEVARHEDLDPAVSRLQPWCGGSHEGRVGGDIRLGLPETGAPGLVPELDRRQRTLLQPPILSPKASSLSVAVRDRQNEIGVIAWIERWVLVIGMAAVGPRWCITGQGDDVHPGRRCAAHQAVRRPPVEVSFAWLDRRPREVLT